MAALISSATASALRPRRPTRLSLRRRSTMRSKPFFTCQKECPTRVHLSFLRWLRLRSFVFCRLLTDTRLCCARAIHRWRRCLNWFRRESAIRVFCRERCRRRACLRSFARRRMRCCSLHPASGRASMCAANSSPASSSTNSRSPSPATRSSPPAAATSTKTAAAHSSTIASRRPSFH